jgi:hypothetical protein
MVNPLNAELTPICHLLVLLLAHHILHVSGVRVKVSLHTACLFFSSILLLLLLQSALQPLDGFRPAQLSLSILSRKVLQSAVASGTSNPQLGGEPAI